MEYVTIGKKKMKKETVKKMRISYLIIGWLSILLGGFSFQAGGSFIFIIGIVLLLVCRKYSKALQASTVKNKAFPNISKSAVIPKTSDSAPATPLLIKTESDISAPVKQLESDTSLQYKTEKHHIAGVTFEGRQDKIKEMGFENEDYHLSKRDFIEFFSENEKVYEMEFSPVNVELIEEPDNPHDSNAIKVVIDGVHVGYIKQGSCAHIKKLLHSDSIVSISADVHGGKYKYYYEEYDEEKDKDVYTIERDSSIFFVTLEIKIKIKK